MVAAAERAPTSHLNALAYPTAPQSRSGRKSEFRTLPNSLPTDRRARPPPDADEKGCPMLRAKSAPGELQNRLFEMNDDARARHELCATF